MMLRTDTLAPPSWLAILPQKFSAATTCNRPEDLRPTEPAELPHPASTPTAAKTAATVSDQDLRNDAPTH
jgi:hypothetical protein